VILIRRTLDLLVSLERTDVLRHLIAAVELEAGQPDDPDTQTLLRGQLRKAHREGPQITPGPTKTAGRVERREVDQNGAR